MKTFSIREILWIINDHFRTLLVPQPQPYRTMTYLQRLLTIFMVIFILLLLAPASIFAQTKKKPMQIKENPMQMATVLTNSDSLYKIILNNESELIGKIVTDSSDFYIVEVDDSKIKLKKSAVLSVKLLNYKRGKIWFDNPHHTRYIYAPTAFNLKKGEKYFSTLYAIPSIYYGVTDHFTFGVTVPLSTFIALQPTVNLTAKWGGYELSPNLRASFGTNALIFNGNIFGNDEQASLSVTGLGFGLLTAGNKDSNVSVGLGYGYSNTGGVLSKPAVNISAIHRFQRKIAFVTENYIIPTGDNSIVVFSYGLKIFGESSSFGFGFVNSPSLLKEIVTFGLPIIDYAYKF